MIFGLILIYGYRSINQFVGKSEQVELIDLRSQVEDAVHSISLDFGSVKRVEVRVPSRFRTLCLVDLEWSASGQSRSDALEHLCAISDLVCGAVKDNLGRVPSQDVHPQNMFLIPQADLEMAVGRIRVSQSPNPDFIQDSDLFACFPVAEGHVVLRLEGLGDRTGISAWPR